MSTQFELIKEMKKRAQASVACIDSLVTTSPENERFNNLLEVALQQQEMACIEMRRLYEQLRKELPHNEKDRKSVVAERIYGSIEITEKSWVHICLNALLPHCKVIGGTQYVTDSILRLLNDCSEKLPFYKKAFIGIIECCPTDCSDVFGSDNTGFKAVQNALKGRLFPDDDRFELSLGLFTEQRNESCCHIYVLPESDAGAFTNLLLSHNLG